MRETLKTSNARDPMVIRDSAAEFAARNETFAAGTLLLENDTAVVKKADGSTAYVDLPETGLTSAEVTALALATMSSGVSAGTAAAGSTAVEAGNLVYHRTTLTVDTVLPAIAGGADLAVGVLAYTFPAGRVVVHASSINLAIQQTEANITADTPDVGLGTVIGSGAVATLDGTAAFENILTGQTFNDCDGTAELKTLATTLVIEAADDHTVYINVADGWAAGGDVAAELTGSVVLLWSLLD